MEPEVTKRFSFSRKYRKIGFEKKNVYHFRFSVIYYAPVKKRYKNHPNEKMCLGARDRKSRGNVKKKCRLIEYV